MTPGGCCTAQRKGPFNFQACPLRPTPGTETRYKSTMAGSKAVICTLVPYPLAPGWHFLQQRTQSLLRQCASGDASGILHLRSQGTADKHFPFFMHLSVVCVSEPSSAQSCLSPVMHRSLSCMASAYLFQHRANKLI